jgi:hypothetical protein
MNTKSGWLTMVLLNSGFVGMAEKSGLSTFTTAAGPQAGRG